MASVRSGTPCGVVRRSRVAQGVPGDDEADDRDGDRPEQFRQRVGEVVGDGAGPGRVAQGGGLAVDPADAVQDELGEEVVEVGEVPVQDALGAARLRRDGPAGQRAGAVPEQDPLGGGEQLLARVAQGHTGRHRAILRVCRPH